MLGCKTERGASSAGQSIGSASRGSRVRIPCSPPGPGKRKRGASRAEATRTRFFDRMEGKTQSSGKRKVENGKTFHSRLSTFNSKERGYSRVPRREAAGQARYATSTVRRTGDALAPGGEEGRGRLRKAAGRRERPLIRGCPNGETRHAGGVST